MASQIILKNGQDQEFSITHPDNVGAININSNELASKDYVTTTIQPKLTGTATLTGTDNKILMTGIVTALRLEVGDVIQISGAEDAKNNSEFTIEVIIDDNNVIVNQAHANKGTSKNVANRSGDTGVTVKLLAKWYNAPIGLGQGWVYIAGARSSGVNYVSLSNRSMQVTARTALGSSGGMVINGVAMPGAPSGGSGLAYYAGGEIIPPNSIYSFASTPYFICELR